MLPARSAMLDVPNLDFRSLDFLASIPGTGQRMASAVPITYSYNGPSLSVQTVAKAVAALNAILPIQPPEFNSSWTMQFAGLSLRCRPLDEHDTLAVWSNVAEWKCQGDNGDTPYTFLSWTQRTPNIFLDLPFIASQASTGENTLTLTPGSLNFDSGPAR
jgi:hypothetical protein